MTHQLSHTFPICDAEAQTPIKPRSLSPHSSLEPAHFTSAALLLSAASGHFLVDGRLKQGAEKGSVWGHFWGHPRYARGDIAVGGMGLQKMWNIWPPYIFSQPTDRFYFIRFWLIESHCWPTGQIKGSCSLMVPSATIPPCCASKQQPPFSCIAVLSGTIEFPFKLSVLHKAVWPLVGWGESGEYLTHSSPLQKYVEAVTVVFCCSCMLHFKCLTVVLSSILLCITSSTFSFYSCFGKRWGFCFKSRLWNCLWIIIFEDSSLRKHNLSVKWTYTYEKDNFLWLSSLVHSIFLKDKWSWERLCIVSYASEWN